MYSEHNSERVALVIHKQDSGIDLAAGPWGASELSVCSPFRHELGIRALQRGHFSFVLHLLTCSLRDAG